MRRSWFSRYPRWFRFTTYLVASSFALMLLFDETRWNVVTELWGAAGIGLLLWWLRERKGEGVARRAWFDENSHLVRQALTDILQFAEFEAALVLALPQEVRDELLSAPSLADRRQAAEAARAAARRIGQGEGAPAVVQ